MSGEAGATLASTYYVLFVGSGVRVSLAIEPGGTGRDSGEWFAHASAPYRIWLERARPELDRLFEQVVGSQRLPLAPVGAPGEEIDGAVIEPDDQAGRHFRRHFRGRPCPVRVNGAGRLGGFRSLTLQLQVSDRVPRAELDRLLASVAAVLTAAEPAPKPSPAAVPATSPTPPERPGSRLLRRLRALFGGPPRR